MQQPRRVFAYTRVSSDEQERSGTSLPAQRAELVAYCERRGWPAPTVIAEVKSGSSEKLEERVELQRMLRDAQAGDAIIVSKVDRWTRDSPSGVQYVRNLVARGVGWISVNENIDAGDPQGDSILGMMAWVADNERKNIRERTLGARRRMRNNGCWTEGVAPFGYRRDPLTRRLAIVEADAKNVRAMFDACVGGKSVNGIVSDLNARQVGRDGGQPIKWHKKGVHTMLRARWYIGEIRNTDGVWMPAHEAIVTMADFDCAQRALTKRANGGRLVAAASRTSEWLLRGLASCSRCGARMGSAYGPRDHRNPYYLCGSRARGHGCQQPYARVGDVDALAAAAIVARLEELCGLLSTQAPAGSTESALARLDEMRRGLSNARLKRERLVTLAVDGTITRAELQDRARKLDVERSTLEAAIAEAERATRPVTAKARADMLRDVRAMTKAWRKATIAQRRDILTDLAVGLRIDDGEPVFDWAPIEALCTETVGRSLKKKTVAVPLNKRRKGR